MIKPAVVLLLLTSLAVLGAFDRDGILARTDLAARALGIELRIDVVVRNVARVPAVPAVPAVPIAPPRAPTCPHEPVPCE